MPDPDLARLTQTELLRLVNATARGAVLSRSRLRRQLDEAGPRVLVDGRRIHLLRYLKWLVLASQRRPAQPVGYDAARDRQAARSRAAVRTAQDIAPVPDVADVARRRRAARSLRAFAETYFAPTFYYRWSAAHLRAIATMERVICQGGLFALAMPRGFGKTSLARVAALWAILTGRRPFVAMIAASDDRAVALLAPIRIWLLEHEELLADWPEAVYPLRCLANSSKRQGGQHVGGRLTHVHWADNRIVFPTIHPSDLPAAFHPKGRRRPPVPCADGSVVAVTSLDANLRGMHHARVNREIIRPSLVLLDDPQTRRSARSPRQTRYRLELLRGDVLAMAGPGQAISVFVLCTKTYQDDLADQLVDAERCPEWQAETTKTLVAMPSNVALWDQYAEARAAGLARGDNGKAAAAFYRKHRAALDAGAVAGWPDRYNRATEVSAVQHAMNLRLTVGAAAFAAEYQNEATTEQVGDDLLTPAKVAAKVNGRKRGVVPLAAVHLTAYVDVHDRVLFWCVCGWQADFTGYVVDYGTHPEQGRRWFVLRTAARTLRQVHPGRGDDGAILAGLKAVVGSLLGREWPRQGGGVLRVGRLLVDSGYKPTLVAAVKHAIGGETMILARGAGITAARRPMTEYQRRPGEQHGHHWYMPSVRGTREFPHVQIDTNYWKTFAHRALATPEGEPGGLSLWGSKAREHELFAEHVAGSETWVETHGRGRTVHEWRVRPTKPDNHWLDCLVGCAVAGCMLGAVSAGMAAGDAGRQGQRKRYTQDDLRRPRARA